MTIRHRAGSATLVLALALALSAALAGCSPTTASPTAQTASPTASGPVVTVVTVTEEEFSISLSEAKLRPGLYTFEVHNEGASTHNLHITGPGIDETETPNIAPDGVVSFAVTLQAGEYDLYCATAGHKEAGMDLTITVR